MDFTEYLGMASSDIEPLPKYRKFVAERQAAGLCLLCDCKVDKRGRCGHHYHRYRMDRLDQPKSKRKRYEDNLILTGKLAPDRQGQRPPKEMHAAKAG